MTSSIASLSAVPSGIALLLLVVFTFLYRRTRDAYIRTWQLAWFAYFVSRTAVTVYFTLDPAPSIEFISNGAFVLMAVCIFRSTRIIHNDERWRQLDTWLVTIGTLWSAYDVLARAYPARWDMIGLGSWRFHHLPVEAACAPLLFIAGIRFWKHAITRGSLGFRVLAFALWFWSLLLPLSQFHFLFFRLGMVGHVLGPIPQMLLGIAMVMVLYESLADEERRRSRYLEFLNAVSRLAISNSDPAQMLAAISSEIRANFKFDHIGLGIVDYVTKEIEISHEAGCSARLAGRRVPVDAGLIGSVAKKPEVLLAQGPGNRDGALLANARSVLCAPIVHGDKVLGVLNVESSQENAFQNPEPLILRTLADLLAAALHNAFVFQGMQQQAITDSLTGNKTRRYFLEALLAEWKRASRSRRPFSLVMVDLDKFKEVNDSAGHMEGDLVMARVGRLLEEHCRKSNVVARYGGDEFVILMPETALEQALVLSERLRGWIANDTMLQEHGITGSFGVAAFPAHGNTPETLLQSADAALYTAKHRGGNCVETISQSAGAAV